MKTKNESAVAFLDLLGFSNLVNKDFENAKEILNDFYNIVYNERNFATEHEIKTILVSDSLIAYTENKVKIIPYLANIYRRCLLKTNEYSNPERYLLPRGGISFGKVYSEDRFETPELAKRFIVSPALVHTSKIEKGFKGSRLIVSMQNNTTDKIDIFWDKDSQSIFYKENTTIDSNFTYYDILWFEDLNTPSSERKEEIEEKLKIALNLLQNNRTLKEEYLAQYIEIVRIGLISYSRYLNIRFDFPPFLIQLFTDYLDEKFWRLWISIIESVLLIHDASWAEANDTFRKFYNTIVISKGWNKAIEYIYQQNQSEILEKIKAYSRKHI
ncbi:hypothetical protein [Leptospira bouyouniensis]|uniref:Guanylate cyclase domain-containing protein n=1 Tax=Leptospira bouyouniensis TaxID=2484911 RepID=A0ABY2KZE4_9LEPT|nr:hypothetical protein [Leptospira bouyouniensis]TGK45952.1 hypothetical protein EHQ10_18545 [Leptospira bouyouniensis]